MRRLAKTVSEGAALGYHYVLNRVSSLPVAREFRGVKCVSGGRMATQAKAELSLRDGLLPFPNQLRRRTAREITFQSRRSLLDST